MPEEELLCLECGAPVATASYPGIGGKDGNLFCSVKCMTSQIHRDWHEEPEPHCSWCKKNPPAV